jgi:hypothetical protein
MYFSKLGCEWECSGSRNEKGGFADSFGLLLRAKYGKFNKSNPTKLIGLLSSY